MAKHLQREIENLKKKLLALGAKIECSVRDATMSIETQDVKLAQKIIDNDIDIDNMEVEIEEDCLKILALHQPVAVDLRFIVAVLKINNDLERIGDLAVNVAERAIFLANQSKFNISTDLLDMARNAQLMLKKSLDSLINHDAKLAHEVCTSDDIVDEMNRQMYLKVQDAIVKNPEQIAPLIHILSASRHLERIADHTTNIAEDVIYMIEGQIVRHRAEEYK
ncbi:MAG: phosphate signaling complex protein PhoU [Sedimentisphaerales bacterium]|nr:phosphate signaling complex protein PhoU [Sedimentisphaerales bacterium]